MHDFKGLKAVEGLAPGYPLHPRFAVTCETRRKHNSFRGKKAVQKINLLGKGLTQEISGDRGSY